MKELRAAPGRAALITITVGMIAVMVTFLSALAAGLSNQSVSALDEVYGKNEAVIVSEGATSLSSSSMSDAARKDVSAWASEHGVSVREIFVSRARVDDTPVTVISDFSLDDDQVAVTDGVSETAVGEGDSLTLAGPMGEQTATIARVVGNKWLDHQAVVFAGRGVMAGLSANPAGMAAPAALVIDESSAAVPSIAEASVLRGGERKNLSASNQGEQTSLNAMTSMLYVISALVVGAFFTVWTVQRLRGVAISSALGASRKVLVADSLAQVLAVLVIGVGGGVALTAGVGWALQSADVMPIVIDASTTVVPGLILAVTGVVGALLALVPVFRVDPTTALANA